MNANSFGSVPIERSSDELSACCKRSILAFIFCLIIAGCLLYGVEEQKSSRANDDGKTIQLPPIFYGTQREIHHSVTLENDTSEVIHIGKLSTSCTCTHASVSKKVVKPGESFRVDLAARIEGRSGPFSAYVMIPGNTGKKWSILVETEILKPVEVQESAIQFGSVPLDKSPVKLLTVKTHSTKSPPLPKVNVISPAGQVPASFTMKDTHVAEISHGVFRRTTQFEVKLNPTISPAYQSMSVEFVGRDANESSNLVTIHWRARNEFEFEPHHLFFNIVGNSPEGCTRILKIQNREQQRFQILSATSSHEAVDVEVLSDAFSDKHGLRLRIDESRVSGFFSGELELTLDLGEDSQKLSVPFAGIYQKMKESEKES